MARMTYDKDQRELAKSRGEALFAVDFDGRTSGDGVSGHYFSYGPQDVQTAKALWLFCIKVTNGTKPRKAFAECFPNGQPPKAETKHRK